MGAAAKNCKKINQNPSIGDSRSFKVVDVDKSKKPVLVMIRSKSVSICNCFHTIRANSGKKRLFKGVPLFDAFV